MPDNRSASSSTRKRWPTPTLKSFDDLPIPFRCVATDLGTSKQVVFHDGSLSFALRSTMSLPAIFTPVEVRRFLSRGWRHSQ